MAGYYEDDLIDAYDEVIPYLEQAKNSLKQLKENFDNKEIIAFDKYNTISDFIQNSETEVESYKEKIKDSRTKIINAKNKRLKEKYDYIS